MAAQEADPNSLLNFYRQLFLLRKNSPALSDSSYRRVEAFSGRNNQSKQLDKTTDTIFSFIRESENERVLVVINYSNRRERARVKLHPVQLLLIGGSASARLTTGPSRAPVVDLPGKSFAVYRIKR